MLSGHKATISISAHTPGDKNASVAAATAAAASVVETIDASHVAINIHRDESTTHLDLATPLIENPAPEIEIKHSINDTPETKHRIRCCYRFSHGLYAAFVQPLYSGWQYVISHKFAFSMAILSGLPNALNALTVSSHTQPKNINHKWWNSLSSEQQALSLFDGAASLSINAVIATVFIPEAVKKAVGSFKKCCQSPKNAIGNSMSFMLGLAAAVASTVIAYTSFEWLSPVLAESSLGENAGSKFGTGLAIGAAGINFVVYFATRYVGIKNFSKKFRDYFFNQDRAFQNNLLDQIYRIKPSEKISVNNLLQHHTLHEEKNVLAFFNALNATYPTSIIREKTYHDYLKQFTLISLDLIITALALGGICLTFDQKFLDGLKTAFKGMDALDHVTQAFIGIPGAIASGMLYASSGLDFRTTLWNMVCHVRANPYDLPKAILLITANYRACGSMSNVAESVVHNPNKFFPALSSNATLSKIYIYENQIGTGINNGKASIAKAFPALINAEKPELSDLHTWLENNKLSSEAVSQLKKGMTWSSM